MKEKAIHITNAAITTPPLSAGTAVVWDSTADPGTGVTFSRRRGWPNVCRATVRIFANQIVTFFADDITVNSSIWRSMNGAGDPTTINTWFERNVLFTSDDHRLRIVAGATPPTVWEISVRLWTDPALSQ